MTRLTTFCIGTARLSPVVCTMRASVWRVMCAAWLLSPAAIDAQTDGREQTADQQVHHVLNRLAFGPRPGDVERVRSIGVDAWIAQQLQPERMDDRALEGWLARFPTIAMPAEALIAKYPPPGQQLARIAARQQMTSDNASTAPRRGAPRSATPILSREDSLALAQSAREAARVTAELSISRVGRAVASERQLLEVMTDFWSNHFSVFVGKQQTRYYVPEYDALLRTHALGSFRELLGAVAHSGAMLYYLDQWQSVADSGRTTLAPPRFAQARGGAGAGVRPRQRAAMQRITVGELLDRGRLPAQQRARLEQLSPEQLERVRAMTLADAQEFITALANSPRRPRGINENYARELMELHTLGVDGGFTQQDVMDVARALTGWTLSRGPQGGAFVFRPEVHDAEAKIILGQTFPAGRGQDEGERVLDLLAAHPSTARFIATKLVRRFVSDVPAEALVERAAATFTRTDGDLREVLRTIVTSDEFFASAAFRAKVKTPFELVVSASRALGGQPDTTRFSAQTVARLGQPIYGRQTPDGWPDTADEWINTGSILNRMNFGLSVGANRLSGARLQAWPVAQELVNAPEEMQVDGLTRALFGGIVSPETRAVLLSGENPLLSQAPVDEADTGDGARRAAMGARRELTGFPKLVGLAIGAPEFQRR